MQYLAILSVSNGQPLSSQMQQWGNVYDARPKRASRWKECFGLSVYRVTMTFFLGALPGRITSMPEAR